MRSIGVALISALVATVLAWLGWVLLFAEFTEVPGAVAYPAGWATLSIDAQNDWLFAHTVKVTGFAALLRIFTNGREFAGPILGFLALLFACALGALVINAVLQRRAP
jgi:hypothetical protein